jgi:hypothetical protein
MHGVPIISGGKIGAPPLHWSAVQSFPSSGASSGASIVTTPPEPSHASFLQSPAVWFETAVPPAVKTKTHCPAAVHERCWHSSSGGSIVQSLATLHSTHAPVAPQTLPPSSAQAEPSASFRCVATPLSQASLVQTVPSSGTSSSALSSTMWPSPSQILVLQSPAVWSAAGSTVPLTTAIVPHCPPRQTGVSQGLEGAGQSVIELHVPSPPLPEETLLVVLLLVVAVPSGTQTLVARSHSYPSAHAADAVHALPARIWS